MANVETYRVQVWETVEGRTSRVMVMEKIGTKEEMTALFENTTAIRGTVYLCRCKAGKARFSRVAQK